MTTAANRDFIRRIHAAIDMNSDAPSGNGRQKWLRDRIMARAGKDLSPQAVRKWFAGQARPRRATMAILASALNTDLAWLTLGDRTEVERSCRRVSLDDRHPCFAWLLSSNRIALCRQGIRGSRPPINADTDTMFLGLLEQGEPHKARTIFDEVGIHLQSDTALAIDAQRPERP